MAATDRPTQEVIEDDVELDKWHESWMNKIAAQASLQGGANAKMAAGKDQARKFGG